MKTEITPLLILERLKADLHLGKEVLQLSGQFQLTKTDLCFARAELLRDIHLEKITKFNLQAKLQFSEVTRRYQEYDSTLKDLTWPAHFPFHIMSGSGAIASGSNIFMFFPQVLGIQGSTTNDYFGFEFVDIWENIFKTNILPCVQRGFSASSQRILAQSLLKKLPEVAYLASVFHEIGHRVGPWQVSPRKKDFLKLTGFKLDILGELATDMLMISLIPELPELAHFIIFQRLFWFGRRGFSNNPTSASINFDNDAWIGSYIWKKIWASGVFTTQNQRIQYHPEKTQEMAIKIRNEIDKLSQLMTDLQSPDTQEAIVFEWMKTTVSHTGKNFMLPNSFIQYLANCSDIAENSAFNPMVKDDWVSATESALESALAEAAI